MLKHLSSEPIWFTMRAYKGSLDNFLAEHGGTLQPNDAAGMIRRIAETLHSLHNLEPPVIHRDLKPKNILLDSERHPIIADFGLAAEYGAEGDGWGTWSYMAPEQIERRDATPAMDLWSLAVILYRVLTGRLPFSRPDQIINRNKKPKPLREIRRSIPPQLEAICLKALSKEPADRYQSAQELATELGNWDEYNCWYRQGVTLLIKTWHVADAIDFLYWIDQKERRMGKEDKQVKGRTHEELGSIISAIIDADKQGTKANGQRDDDVDAEKLWELFQRSYATNDLEHIIGWIGSTKSDDKWKKLVPLFLKTGDYVVRRAAGCGQAKRFKSLFKEGRLDFAQTEIETLLKGDANEQEMAFYAIAELGEEKKFREKAWFEKWLVCMSESELYSARSALGGMLTEWRLHDKHNGNDDGKRQIEGLALKDYWNPIWQYLRNDVIAILAEGPRLDGASFSSAYAEYEDDIKAYSVFSTGLEAQREELRSTFASKRSLTSLINAHLGGASDDKETESPEDWSRTQRKEMQELFEKAGGDGHRAPTSLVSATSLMRYLFSHPVWSKAEGAAAILEHCSSQSQCRQAVFKVVNQLLLNEQENWRVHFGVLEATFLLRRVDPKSFESEAFDESPDSSINLDFGWFEKGVCQFYKHDNCLIRGLCAENFVADLADRHPSEWLVRLEYSYFEKAIARWLIDEDCWILEHMYRLFRLLKEQSKENNSPLSEWMQKMLSGVRRFPDSLLCRISQIDGEWHSLDRAQFLHQLELCRKKQLAERQR